MNAQEFCYWLQGFMEVQNPETLTKEQVLTVKDHLGLVFGKITPDRTIQPAAPSPGVKDLEKMLKEFERVEREREKKRSKPDSLRGRIRRAMPKPLRWHSTDDPFTRVYC